MNEFDAMDDAEVPDQWDEIVERSALAGRVEAEGGRSRRGLAGGAIAAAVLVVTLVAGLVALDRSGDEETVTLDTGPASETTDPEATDPEAIDPEVAEADDAEPHLVCPTGELAAGSIPDDAGLGGIPVWGTEVIGDRTTWGWREIPLEVQLIVPGIQTVSLPATIETEEIDRDRGDVAGTISHAVSHDDGRESVNVSIPTGLDGPCAWSTVAVAGGTEAERTALAMHLAQELDWVETPPVTDPDDVVDARTMRSYTMSLAAERTPVGTHRAELWVDRRFSASGVGGPAIAGPHSAPQWIWSGLLRVPGVPADSDTVTTASVGETGESFSSGGQYPLGLTDRAESEPIPALIVGTLEA